MKQDTKVDFRQRRTGFTLIELLIVVAIIAILAAIAVPNFLEAQTRAKVSRVQADLRSLATGLESYQVDNNHYPPVPFTNGDVSFIRVVPTRLSTPIAYITTANFKDPFVDPKVGDFQILTPSGSLETYSGYNNDPEGYDATAGQRYYYSDNEGQRRSSGPKEALVAAQPIEGMWALASFGPNRKRDFSPTTSFTSPGGINPQVLTPYDPTNGTISDGDIVRTQKQSKGTLVD